MSSYSIESRPVTIGVNTGWQIEYTHNPLEHLGPRVNGTDDPRFLYQEEGSPIVHVMRTDTIIGESRYQLEYSSEDESHYFKYLPIVQKVIDSFEIIPTTSTTTIPSDTLPPTGMIPKEQPMQTDLVSLLHQATPLQSRGGEDSNALSYNIKAWIDTPSAVMSSIQKVTYYLHPTFNPSVITVDKPDDNFALSLNVWGQFELKATVYFKDGTTKDISRYLSFDSSQQQLGQ